MPARTSVQTFPVAYANRCPDAAPTPSSSIVKGGSLHLRGGTLTVKPVLKFANGAFGAEVEGIDWDVAQLDESLVADVSRRSITTSRNTSVRS